MKLLRNKLGSGPKIIAMKKFVLLSYFLVGLFGFVWAQPTFEIDNTTGDPGTVVSVNFKVDDFADIVGMQFTINWDPAVLSFNSLTNITNQIDDFDEGSFNTDPNWVNNGNISVSWFDFGAEGNTVPDGTIIFTLNFDVVGGSGSSTVVTISGEPRAIEVINEAEEDIGLNVSGGQFTATGNGGGGTFRLLGSDEMGANGETVCVEVSTQGFTNILGMQFSINWDPSALQFTEVGAFNLEGLNEATFNTDDVAEGKLGLQWNDPAVNEGITVPNGTVIFNVCFRIVGDGGRETVSFTNDPVSIEILDADENRLTFAKKDGSVTIDGSGGGSDCDVEGFALEATQENADPGTQVCVDIKVKGFNSITTMGSTIEWNSAILSNPTIESINLPDLNEELFNLDQGANGIISFIWLDNTTEGIDLADGTSIFTICYDVIGSDGQSTTISFTDGITEREVTQDGMSIDFHQCDGSVTLGNGMGGISVTSNVESPSCAGEDDGSIDISVSGGTSPYSYEWMKDGNVISNDEDLDNIPAGTYTVNVTDDTGGETSSEIVVNDPDGVEIIDAEIVDGSGMDGSISLTVSGGATPLDYMWSNGETTRDIAGLEQGTYSLTITDANGCTLDTSFNVGAGDLMVDISTMRVTCNGEEDGVLMAEVNGGTGPYTYSWSNGGTGSSITGLAPGNYTVTVTDAAGASVESDAEMTEPNQLIVNVETTPSPNNVEGTALANVSGGTEPYTYRWNDGNPPSTTRLIINLAQGSYTVLVTDDNGCMAQGTGPVTESDVECFSGKEVMTPNNDGRNDQFNIACVEGTDNELEIYSRQGELVYETSNYNNDWLGTDNNGEELEDGAYYWVLRVRRSGILEQFTGHLTLLRNLN